MHSIAFAHTRHELVKDAQERPMSQRDAEVLGEIGVDDGAKAGELALILDDLEDAHEYLEDARLYALCVHLERALAERPRRCCASSAAAAVVVVRTIEQWSFHAVVVVVVVVDIIEIEEDVDELVESGLQELDNLGRLLVAQRAQLVQIGEQRRVAVAVRPHVRREREQVEQRHVLRQLCAHHFDAHVQIVAHFLTCATTTTTTSSRATRRRRRRAHRLDHSGAQRWRQIAQRIVVVATACCS